MKNFRSATSRNLSPDTNRDFVYSVLHCSAWCRAFLNSITCMKCYTNNFYESGGKSRKNIFSFGHEIWNFSFNDRGDNRLKIFFH